MNGTLDREGVELTSTDVLLTLDEVNPHQPKDEEIRAQLANLWEMDVGKITTTQICKVHVARASMLEVFKTLEEVCAQLAENKGVDVADIPPDKVLAYLEHLEKSGSLIDTCVHEDVKRWKIHLLK